jgi:GAF domain-containing protein
MTVDFEGATRVWSNRPEAYPVSGTKGTPEGDWAEVVLVRREIFVANDAAGLAAVFPDHELIASLGCASVLNVPVVVGDRVLGAINCLDGAGHYTPARVAAAEALRLPGAAAFLVWEAAQRARPPE